MKRTQTVVFGLLAVILALSFTACPGPTQPTLEQEPPATTSSITGRAVFSDGTDSGGIVITLEGTDGLRSASMVSAGRSLAGTRSIGAGSFIAATQTMADGSFTLSDIPAGTYILHASSRDSMEQAVAIGVTVAAGEVLGLETLMLTPVGRIAGRIVVDGGDSDAWGFLVSVAGTSFMSVTDIGGRFTISGVPAGDDHHIIITRGHFTALFTPYAQTVTGGQTTYVGNKYITGTDLDIASVVSIGPNGNWWINGVDTNIPARGPEGPEGPQGPQGERGPPGSAGNSPLIVDGYWWVGGENTGVPASGAAGPAGVTPEIRGGYWWIGGENTGVPATGSAGPAGVSPVIVNGYWWVGDKNTGVPATGATGSAGTSPEIRDGYWWIGNENTGVPATGATGSAGASPVVIDGYWWVGDVNTRVPATGVAGPAGASPEIRDGYWWVGNVNTGIPAQGPQGIQGPEGSTGFVPVEGISLNEDNLSLSIGQSQSLTATVSPSNATITAILWSSSRPDIASIDMLTGRVTAHTPGVVTITAVTMQGNLAATSIVTVTATTAGPSSPLASRLLIFQVGASANGAISRSFIELYNTTDDPIDLSTFSLQWVNGSGANWNVINLTGTIPARGSYLVVGDVTSPGGRLQIDTADRVVEGFQLNNRQFKVALIANQDRLTVANPFAMPGGGRAADYVDMVGAINTGDSIDAFETAAAGYISQQAAVRRVSITDTNNNSADFIRTDYRDVILEQVRPRSSHDGAWEPFPGTAVRQILPSLHLSIAPFERGGPNALDRYIWRPTTVSLRGTGIYHEFSFEEVRAEARGRGNFTWIASDKRPLRIRFDTARPMFGSSYTARDWTLIANALEHSMVRQYSAYFLGALLDGLDFSPTGHFLHLYMDGEYRGVYMLSDQIHVHQGRVELTHNIDPMLSEYFFEKCNRVPNESGPYFTVNGIHFGIEFPGSGILNQNLGHRQFAEDFMTRVYSALIREAFNVDESPGITIYRNDPNWTGWNRLVSSGLPNTGGVTREDGVLVVTGTSHIRRSFPVGARPSPGNIVTVRARQVSGELGNLSSGFGSGEGHLSITYGRLSRDWQTFHAFVPGTVIDGFNITRSNRSTVEGRLEISDVYIMTADFMGDYGISRLIDIPSFVDYYLVQEFFKNQDMNSSLFFQIRQTATGPKLFAGPLWDFDRSSGFTATIDPSPQGARASLANRFFRPLMNIDWFREQVGIRWREIRDREVVTMMTRIIYLTQKYQICFEFNFERWPDKHERRGTPMMTPSYIIELPFIEQVEYLLDWFQQRKVWMDGFLQ